MIHAVTCADCNRPITGRILKDEFKQTVCVACFNGETITPVVAAPIIKPENKAPPTCEFDGCTDKVKAKGLCMKHYCTNQRNIIPTTCTIEGCDKRARSIGLCRRHYQIDWRARQPQKPPVIITTDPTQPGCIVVGCTKPRRERGVCSAHRSHVRRHKLNSVLLPPIPPVARNIGWRHSQRPASLLPMDLMAEVVVLKKSGKTWHQAAIDAGCQSPTLDMVRVKNNYRRGKIPGHTPPNPHR
jgi:hypothetical protein